jgi:plastocyanin
MVIGMMSALSRVGWVGIASIVVAAHAGCGRQVNLGPVADLSTAKAMREALTGGKAAEGTEEAAAATGTGWATLRGQFLYDGTPPSMAPYNVSKEHDICAPGGKNPPQETLVVDSASGGIKNVAIFLRSASRVHESARAQTEPIDFDQKSCVFLTHVLAVGVGQPIHIKNSDPTGHNTKIEGRANKFNQTIPSGASIPFTPQREEAAPAPITCSIHPWMIAYMLPRANGYFAVTDAEGRFEIANLPAGEPIEFQVWHENGAAPGNGLVGASPAAPELKWNNRGRVTVTLQPDDVKDVKIVVAPGAFRG